MRILVADDSKAMRMIVIRTLRQSDVEISEIQEAADGAEALALVPDFNPHLILSDWNMPNKTGIEFLTDLRATGDTTPFGFVTSESNPSMREQALRSGAQFLLTKPFDGARFAEVIAGSVAS